MEEEEREKRGTLEEIEGMKGSISPARSKTTPKATLIIVPQASTSSGLPFNNTQGFVSYTITNCLNDQSKLMLLSGTLYVITLLLWSLRKVRSNFFVKQFSRVENKFSCLYWKLVSKVNSLLLVQNGGNWRQKCMNIEEAEGNILNKSSMYC